MDGQLTIGAKTIFEKARLYAHTKVAVEKDMVCSVHELRKWAEKDYLAGYNEATRWRDLVIELPPADEKVLLKYNDTVKIGYRYKDNSWHIEGLGKVDVGKIMGWKAIIN